METIAISFSEDVLLEPIDLSSLSGSDEASLIIAAGSPLPLTQAGSTEDPLLRTRYPVGVGGAAEVGSTEKLEIAPPSDQDDSRWR